MIGSFMREDDLVVEPIRIEDGYLRAPVAPGLGITLDEAAIARYAV